MDELTNLTEKIIAIYFGSSTDLSLRTHLGHLLACTQSIHQTKTNGPLRQSLILTTRPPTYVASRKKWAGSRADIRLELSNGQIHALRVCGDIDVVLGRLEMAASCLLRQPLDEKPSDYLARELTAELHANASTRTTFTLSFPKHAAVTPPSSVSLRMMKSMSLDVLNALLKGYGFAPFDELPDLLDTHFTTCAAMTRTMVQRYLDLLDQNALSLVQQFALDFHPRYDHIRTYNFMTGGYGQCSRNRVQAMRELPWLLRPLCNLNTLFSITNKEFITPPVLKDATRRDILQAIDEGHPLFAAVSRALQLPRETVKWSRRQRLPETLFGDNRWMQFTLCAVSWVPREKRPVTNDQWDCLRRVVSTCVSILTACWHSKECPTDLSSELRYDRIMRDWLVTLLQPDLAAADRRLQRMDEQQQDHHALKDFLQTLQRAMPTFGVRPDGRPQREEATIDPFLDWLEHQSLQRIGTLSRAWHDAIAIAHVRREQSGPNASMHSMPTTWPPVLVDPLAIGAHTVRELFSDDRLQEEGHRMRHCVANYAPQCVFGSALIFSIRDADNIPLSTVELSLDATMLQVSLVQHKGPENRKPPLACITTATRLVNELNSHKYRALLARRFDEQRERNAQRDNDWHRRMQRINEAEQSVQATAWQLTFGTLPNESASTIHL